MNNRFYTKWILFLELFCCITACGSRGTGVILTAEDQRLQMIALIDSAALQTIMSLDSVDGNNLIEGISAGSRKGESVGYRIYDGIILYLILLNNRNMSSRFSRSRPFSSTTAST